jgi:hypothetical protein
MRLRFNISASIRRDAAKSPRKTPNIIRKGNLGRYKLIKYITLNPRISMAARHQAIWRDRNCDNMRKIGPIIMGRNMVAKVTENVTYQYSLKVQR